MADDKDLRVAYERAIDALEWRASAARNKGNMGLAEPCTEASATLVRNRPLVANAERLLKAARPLADKFMKREGDLAELRKVLKAIADGMASPRLPPAGDADRRDAATASRIESAVGNCSLVSSRLDGLERNVNYIFTRLADLDRTVAKIQLPASDGCIYTPELTDAELTNDDRLVRSLPVEDRLRALEWNHRKVWERLTTMRDIVARLNGEFDDTATACICSDARQYAVDRGHGMCTWHCPAHGGQTFIFQKDYKGGEG